MSTSHSLQDALNRMPALAQLFQLFSSGFHLNRLSEPVLWAQLEKYQEDYCALFKVLGYDLKIDARGYAWFHHSEAYSQINKTSRQLALLFMLIFDVRANDGKQLQRFTDWLIDKDALHELYKQQTDLLEAEELFFDNLVDLMNRATSLGLAKAEGGGWYLLPAVYRYLDHVEELAPILSEEEQVNALSDQDDSLEDINHGETI